MMKPSIYWLLVFIPITLVLEHASQLPPAVIFFAAALSIVPIAVISLLVPSAFSRILAPESTIRQEH